MIIDPHASVFERSFLVLKFLSAAYVIGIFVFHFAFPNVWVVAMVLSVAMNFTYPWAAIRGQRFVPVEIGVSTTLVVMAILGVLASPLWVIASIFGHGVWDLFKHNGQGVPFFKWYTQGCVVVDWFYAASLTLYLISGL